LDKEQLKKKLLLLKQSEELITRRNATYAELIAQGNPALKKEIQEIDHQLDLLMDEEELSPIQLLQEMAEEVVQEIPASTASYQRLQEEGSVQRKEAEELEKVRPFIEKYHHYFGKAAALLAKGKKKSLLALLFGRHPKVLLSYEIATLSKEASEDLTRLKELVMTGPAKKVHLSLVALLETLQAEANKKWNRALYEEAFFHFHTQISQLKSELTQLQSANRQQSEQLFQKTELWLAGWLT